jgi:hypothetical protein
MYFMAPIGWLPVGQGYFAWQLIFQAVIAITIFLLLRGEKGARALLVPIYIFLLFFGPVYLSLQVGSVGAIFLLALALTILCLQTDRPWLAGLALSVTLLKPPQALTLLLLAGVWFVVQRQWKVLAGIAVGGLALLVVWLARDPLGLVKFRGSSDFLLSHTLGTQSNVFAFAYLACGSNVTCMWIAGWVAALGVLAVGALMLYRNRSRWDDWQAFNLLIPLSFVSAVYLWSYDQLLYIVPVIWILTRFRRGQSGYLRAFAFLALLDVVSFVALGVQAYTQQDLLSILTTLLVLAAFLWLQRSAPAATPLPAQPS